MFDIISIDKPSTPAEMKNIQLLHRLIDPHCYSDDDSVYGENCIFDLMRDSSVAINKWPDANVKNISVIAGEIDKARLQLNFYEKESQKMIKQYVDHMISINQIKSYEDIVIKSNLVDMTSLMKTIYKDEDSYTFDDETIAYLRTHKWYTFIPCYQEMTLQVNRKQYLHIELLNVDERAQMISVRITKYVGDRINWISTSSIVITMTFGKNNSMSFQHTDCRTYEETLLEHIPNMKWSKKHIQFWNDLFGVSSIDNIGIISIADDIADESNATSMETLVLNVPALTKLKRSFDFVRFSVKSSGAEAFAEMHNNFAAKQTETYLRTIALLNNSLFIHPGIENDPSKDKYGRNLTSYNDHIVIHSDKPPIIPAEGNTAKPIPKERI